jgi:glycine dehydrogenase subunit 2
MEQTLHELSSPGQSGYSVPEIDVPLGDIDKMLPPGARQTAAPDLPEVSEPDLRRHFTRLSQLNYALSTQFYPLGSCTMKYNPPVNEKISQLPGFSSLHPYQSEETLQGLMEALFNLGQAFCEITGMDRFTLQPAAGAHGEFTGLLIIRQYFAVRKERRTKIIVPDSAHGTNPASAALAGFEILPLTSEPDGSIDPAKLKSLLTPEVAAIMLTMPNTLGVFDKNITEIARLAHANGSLMYYDGANLNALLGVARPGDLGFDLTHINLHKTFSTPHGGGGPGSGPVGVKKHLEPYLPAPLIQQTGLRYTFDYDRPQSIGRVRSFYGNIPVLIKAYAYILALGGNGLRAAGQQAVLNANYLLALLKKSLPAPAGDRCMHEFVLSAKPYVKKGVRTLDIAKRLLDYGVYAPTIYFPLIVEEAIMVEPTETESKQTLDAFAETFMKILGEADTAPDLLHAAPQTTPVSRLNEVEAARKPVLHW